MPLSEEPTCSMHPFWSVGFCLAALVHAEPSSTTVLVTGATGRTGSLAYLKFKDLGFEVRGLVRNVTKAQERLKCLKCDETEGIFVGDVRNSSTLEAAFTGVEFAVILTSSSPVQGPNGTWSFPNGSYPIDIDYKGCINQVRQAMNHGVSQIILVSSFGTTKPENPNDPMSTGHVLLYKLNAEASLMGSGLDFTIIKPAGLVSTPGGKNLLLIGQQDSCMQEGLFSISREDLADVCVQAVLNTDISRGLRFDLVSDPSKPATGDLKTLLQSAQKNRI
mmetsp:Transcript_35416/g.59998  ORF Transcript_35416/g.59998 Transcript_35416/m.59998 type:complete len:277 (+) Transcript_35416:28-858(+)